MPADFATMQVNGRLTKDPQEYKIGDNSKVVFSVAVNRNFKKDEEWVKKPTFIDCVAWGGSGRHILEHGKKGVKVTMTGNWETERYTTGDNKEVVRSQLNVENISVFSAKEDSADAAPSKGGITY